MKNLRVAVVGVGQMGRHHARVYSQVRGVDLVGVVDVDQRSADATAALYSCQGFNTIDPILDRVDAVSIATPPATHAEIGTQLMNHGIHCLIEKPLATSEDQCRQLIHAADKNNVVLLVGHIERFNPAIQKLTTLLSQGQRIYAMDVRRMSRASARITDVDVIADLMTHDLDIVMTLIDRPITGIVASGVHTPDSTGGDYVSALLSFDGGAMATLTASRITQNKVRELSVTCDLGWIVCNFMTQQLSIYRQNPMDGTDLGTTRKPHYDVDLSIERIAVRQAEPLAMELQHFVDAVRGHTPPLVTGHQALAVLKATQTIRSSAAVGRLEHAWAIDASVSSCRG
ncbi:MAG: Oxidoreductase [Magnetococcales bacterium]|nr:Oxidoreductase [Magnetococcales bacterium]HIJ82593.1 Gfo/Idh/MocA family oxidoreductase [Magnetococcales bacterium]